MSENISKEIKPENPGENNFLSKPKEFLVKILKYMKFGILMPLKLFTVLAIRPLALYSTYDEPSYELKLCPTKKKSSHLSFFIFFWKRCFFPEKMKRKPTSPAMRNNEFNSRCLTAVTRRANSSVQS